MDTTIAELRKLGYKEGNDLSEFIYSYLIGVVKNIKNADLIEHEDLIANELLHYLNFYIRNVHMCVYSIITNAHIKFISSDKDFIDLVDEYSWLFDEFIEIFLQTLEGEIK